MTIDQFISKYSGKKIDFDGAYQGQCVDLFRQYIKEVIDLTVQPRGVQGAADFWTQYDNDPVLKNNFSKINNSLTAVPQKGDVVLWNKLAGGGFGHVAVFVSGDVNKFISFDQNWRQLSVCEITNHNYDKVYGWLRPFKNVNNNLPSPTNPQQESKPMTYQKLGLKNDEELLAKITENLGLSWGSENEQADPEFKGGYLGSARREISDLKGKMEKLQKDYDFALANGANQRDLQLLQQAGINELQSKVASLLSENEEIKKKLVASEQENKNGNSAINEELLAEIPLGKVLIRLLKTK